MNDVVKKLYHDIGSNDVGYAYCEEDIVNKIKEVGFDIVKIYQRVDDEEEKILKFHSTNYDDISLEGQHMLEVIIENGVLGGVVYDNEMYGMW